MEKERENSEGDNLIYTYLADHPRVIYSYSYSIDSSGS